jgi:transaldolase / glucose-6-phosphate isomerase
MTTPVTIPNAAGTNPLKGLLEYGQSPWMDYIRRDLLTGGGLKKMIDEDGLRGMTSNPAIFEKSITGSTMYSDILNSAEVKSLDAKGIYEKIAIRDVQGACDIFKSTYQATHRRDGYVSLEVSPYLANDTKGTLEEARRLWKTVGRENLMIKVPGTVEGVPAIRQLLEDGLNINITLLFAQSAYEAVVEAFFAALEVRALKGLELSHSASVASFFVSRIDTLVDSRIEELRKSVKGAPGDLLDKIEGKVAIANAKLTYKKYQELYDAPRWKALAAKGAQPQRLLWASTSTKNPKYRDVLYVEELIGAETVDTIPPATFDAFREHGKLRKSLIEDVPGAATVMENLGQAGISMKEVTDKLLVDGVQLFAGAFRTLLDATGKSAGARQS